jgi:DNA repair protein RadC
MLSLHEMPEDERPRERLVRKGPYALSIAELLAIQLGTGHAGDHAVSVSAGLIREAGSLPALARFSLDELIAVKGVGPVKALRLLSAFELGRRLFTAREEGVQHRIHAPQDVLNLLGPDMRYLLQEHFVCIFLNTKHVVIGKETLSIGTLDSTLVHPREVFKAAVRRSASSIICVHNHPSGDPTPSHDDIVITRRLIDAGKLMGIEVLDHVIIGDGRYASMKELGLISPLSAT